MASSAPPQWHARQVGSQESPPPPLTRPAPFLRFFAIPEGLLALVGFAAAAEAMALSVAAAGWQPGLAGAPVLVALAIALNYVFSRGRGVRWPFHVAGILAGLVIAARVAASGFLSPRLTWQNQVYAVLARLSDWVAKSVAGGVYQDDLLVALALAAFLFAWTYLCYWLALRRHLAWLSAGMIGAALFANVQLKPATGATYLVLWAAGSLVMILRITLFRRELLHRTLAFAGWRRGQQLGLAGGLLIALLATTVFAMAPQVQVNKTLNDLWTRLNGPIGQAKRAYDAIGVPNQLDASQIRIDSFQPQLRFLGPFKPGTDLVMKVRADRARYHQGVVFDQYQHDGWTNTKFNQFQINSSDYSTLTGNQETSRDRDRQQVAEDIIQVLPKGALLFAAPLPLGASVKLKGDGFGDLRATDVIKPNQLYTAASLESTATAESLAAATGPIPADIRANFLQLPADLPARVHQLALDQTAGRTTEFDKAVALESYMRTYPFDTQVPPPPADRDAVDWYLFDLRRGYCDYDSSAMAVMLRTLGIPARVVAGYSPGQLDPTDGLYHVTEKETHTWTQAYFPGYGWIDFEPTPDNPPYPRAHSPRPLQGGAATQPTPTIVPSATPTQGPGPGANASGTKGSGSGSSSSFPWWLVVLLVGAGVGIAWFVRSRMRGTPGARLAYARVTFLGTLLGLRPHAWQTPQEFGRELQARRRFDPGATDTVTSLYAAERYGPRSLDARTNRRAWTAWQYLKGRLLRPWRRGGSSGEG